MGKLLLAADFQADPSELAAFQPVLRGASELPLEKVGTLTLDPTLFRPAPENVASKTSSITRVKPTSERSARATILERVLKSVVTVDAGSKIGSGFFVGAGGLLLTNAHVIEGASKVVVRTQDKARFLATMVSTSVQHDLALLRSLGPPRPGFRSVMQVISTLAWM